MSATFAKIGGKLFHKWIKKGVFVECSMLTIKFVLVNFFLFAAWLIIDDQLIVWILQFWVASKWHKAYKSKPIERRFRNTRIPDRHHWAK